MSTSDQGRLAAEVLSLLRQDVSCFHLEATKSDLLLLYIRRHCCPVERLLSASQVFVTTRLRCSIWGVMDFNAIRECVELLRAREPVLLDDAFGDDLLQILAEEPLEERPSWDC